MTKDSSSLSPAMGKRKLILRRALSGAGALLILIGVPIGILTPIPAVPIGLTIVVLGAALLARNSEAGRKWLSGIISRYPRISALTPKWLNALVFGAEEQAATDSPATIKPLSEGPLSWRYASIIAFLLLAYVSFAAAVSRGLLAPLDSGLAEVVYGMRSAPLTDVMVAITSFGDANALSIFAVVLVTTLLTVQAWWPAVLSTLAILATYLGVLATKAILVRDRPTPDLYSGVDAFSFPSGHMANSIVILGIAGFLLAFSLAKPARIYVFGFAMVFLALMGLTRVYLGAHWPSDVDHRSERSHRW